MILINRWSNLHLSLPLIYLCLLISACDNEFGKSEIPEQDDKVLVYFGYSGLTMRSVLPNISMDDITNFKLYGVVSANSNRKETLLAEFKKNNVDNVSVYIRPVIWNFTLEAYNSNGYLMFMGTRKDVNISNGNLGIVHFYLSPVTDYEGSAKITIKLPDNTFVDIVETTVNGEILEPQLEIEDGIIGFEKTMKSGDYLVNFFLKDSESRLLAVITEILVIRDNLKSVKTITLTDDDFNVPSAPANVQLVSVSTVTASLSWDTVNIANGYNIYRSGSQNGVYTKLNSIAINGTEFVDNSVMPDLIYYYKVSSINSDIEGFQSEIIPVATLSSVPANVRNTSISTTRVSLVWNTVNGASGYNIYRSGSRNGVYVKLNSIGINGTEFVDNSVMPDLIYYYKVSSINSDIEGLQSEIIPVATLSSVPTNVQITSTKATSISFGWDAVVRASGYNIYRSGNEYGVYEKINTAAIAENKFTDIELTGSSVYYYKIRAVFGDFEGRESVPISARTISSIISIINFIDITVFEPDLPDIMDIIQLAKDSRIITATMTGEGWSNEYQWFLNGVKITETHPWYSKGIAITDNSIEVNWQLPIGNYELSVVATKNNIPYSASVTFNVLFTDRYYGGDYE